MDVCLYLPTGAVFVVEQKSSPTPPCLPLTMQIMSRPVRDYISAPLFLVAKASDDTTGIIKIPGMWFCVSGIKLPGLFSSIIN
jgi:hypothetical protein